MGKRWTAADLKKLPDRMVPAPLLKALTGVKVVDKPKRGKAKSKQPEEKANLGMAIYAICKNGGFAFHREYKFHSDRKFEFDWALPELKIALEYEGLQSDISGHTTLVGYTSNCEKYNLALRCGWRVLRYTAKNYKDAGRDLLDLINQSTQPL